MLKSKKRLLDERVAMMNNTYLKEVIKWKEKYIQDKSFRDYVMDVVEGSINIYDKNIHSSG